MASIRRKFLIKKIISLFISIFASKFRCMEPKHLNRLRVIIAEKNLTNKWLSEQLGVGQATISKWVQNNAQPVFQMLLLMAEGYAARYRGAAAFDFQAVMEDFEKNIAILRKNFYPKIRNYHPIHD